MPPPKDKWVRRFIITETDRHKRGFTIYKVTSIVSLLILHFDSMFFNLLCYCW